MAHGRRKPAANPATRRMLKKLERQGCTIGGTGHPKVYTPCGQMIVVSGSPGAGRALENTRARFKRLGLEV